MKKAIIIIIAVVGLSTAVLALVKPFGRESTDIAMETKAVIKGEINEVITSTGTLEALETVEVGTQVSGIIDKIYVDYNSVVKKGQLLAQIDETPLLAQLEQSQASVESAEAEADFQEANHERYKALSEKDLIAELDYKQVEYNYRKAKAALKNARSVHEKNRINLGYATITSPIDGIILDRAVDEGQTVAASFNTPTMFTIANDLTEMQVEANVDEADIGQVKEGQRVEFTVDAFPDMKFYGEVTQIRLQPVESSNVITYTVIINAPNDALKLMPGMTANISFFVMEKKDILLMPAEALNFVPDPGNLQSYLEQHPGVEIKTPGKFPAPGMEGAPAPGNGPRSGEAPGTMVWVTRYNVIKPVPVELGETDELYYEVLEGLQEGDTVITVMNAAHPKNTGQATRKNNGSRSPFMPKRPGGSNPPRQN
jgi:HlyD family secretion protein